MTDPAAIRALAIHAEDLVAAVEANERETKRVVLRATPPYSGRMRARLHVVDEGADDDGTLHVQPEALLRESAPPYPDPDVTEDELRQHADESYSVERHRTYHEKRVAEWRDAVSEHVVDSVELPAVGHEVEVAILGP
ncbi:hypothetical protein ACFQJ5_15710 [Halomicroarcula sp. GCM10025324]|uniref:hypothetical protein n=1 Tax=Haloarcula TaxID=2237 RepID=UPI0023E84CA9|nr:hypothetical protein [Halomicroarcula sp. ZS-22-S1]